MKLNRLMKEFDIKSTVISCLCDYFALFNTLFKWQNFKLQAITWTCQKNPSHMGSNYLSVAQREVEFKYTCKICSGA